MMHSLESCNFLKVDKDNYLLFACAKPEKREVSVQQEFVIPDKVNNTYETDFMKIYNIKIWTITLRELMLMQSLYVCKTQSDIVDLVND